MKSIPARVTSRAFIILAILLALLPEASLAQTGAPHQPKVQIDLIAEKAAVAPGDRVTVALREAITLGWHTYWTNPGDSGEPTRISWQLPAGFSATATQWPLPKAIPVGPLMNFGYSDEVLLLSDISVPKNAAGDSFEVTANAKWLVCQEICVPEEASATLKLPLIPPGVSARPSPNAAAIEAARKTVPQPMPWPAKFDMSGDSLTLKVDGVGEALPRDAGIHFFPIEWGYINHAAPQAVSFDKDGVFLTIPRGDLSDANKPAALDGVLAVETQKPDGTTARRGYSISAAASAVPMIAPEAAAASEPGGGLSLILALGFAFLGGLILNLMPCVFPVLSLKALSLAKDGGNDKARRVKGLVYLAGVLVSFAGIALALVVLRAAGMAIGWGMQFQSPAFVLAMMALFLALALNLSGVFALGGSVTGVGDSLTRRSGLSGYFFTGVLATVVATPCTAPFMGAAMGYAFSQPGLTVFAVLLALGVGFALPIVLLSVSPGVGRWLPKPGAWMETFKQLMAFPLYATVGWLLWVLSIQQGSDGVMAGSVTLLGVAFAAWLLGRRPEGAGLRGAVAAAIGLAAFGLGVSLTNAGADRTHLAAGTADTSGPKAEAFTQARLTELIGQNKPVFVNLTAAWCITCKVNERVALRSERIGKAFEQGGIAYLVGDWTNGNPEITALLKAHGRVGVPLYLLYPGTAGAKPQILPQLLTESIVLDRLAALPSSTLKQAKGDF